MSNGLSISSSSSWKYIAQHFPASRSGSNVYRPQLVAPSLACVRLATIQQSPKLHQPPPRTEIQPTERASPCNILYLMDNLKLPIPEDMYTTLLKECTELGDAVEGGKVHAHMINHVDLCSNLLMLNRLLLMYISCGQLHTAVSLFNGMAIRDSVSWAAMIAGHAENGDFVNVLRLFAKMREEDGLNPTPLLLVCIFKACVHVNNIRFGEQVHCWLLKKTKKLDRRSDMPVVASLINLYAKYGHMDMARNVFEKMGRDCDGTAPWNVLMAGYCRKDKYDEVLKIFKEMKGEGKKWKSFAFPSVLRACGRMGDGLVGRQVHAASIKTGVESNLFIQSSLVDMYGKCGLFGEARKVLEISTVVPCSIKSKTDDSKIICWNAMLTAYTSWGLSTEAIKLLYEMKAAGVEPVDSMLCHVRTACGS